MIDLHHPDLSIRRQCELVGLNRATFYWEPAGESEQNLALMRLIDAQFTRTPFYGYRRMTVYLRKQEGQEVNPKRVVRLMRKRSEERRGGTECSTRGRSRWSP